MLNQWLAIILLAASAAGPASTTSRHRTVVAGPTEMAAADSANHTIVISAVMEHARLKGTLRVSGGAASDIELSLFREGTGHTAPAPFKSGRTTVADVDLELEPGAYRLVLMSHGAGTLSGALTLWWSEDGSLPSGQALKNQIRFSPLPEKRSRVEVPFRAGAGRGTVVIARADDAELYSIAVRKPDGTTTREKAVGEMVSDRLSEVGTIDADGDQEEEVFIVGESVGSGAGSKELLLVSTTKLAVLSALLYLPYQATAAIAVVDYSENFTDPRYRLEQSFLERIKSAYAPTSEDEINEDDPRQVFYTWAKAHGSVRDGPMTIRRYRGRPAAFGSTNDELTDGSITYYALFKAGVIAYDASTDDHYALFHPKDLYAWPTVLKKLGPHLIIGTRGEGLAIVDTRKMTLRRVPVPGAKDVERIEVIGSKLRINGTVDIEAPAN